MVINATNLTVFYVSFIQCTKLNPSLLFRLRFLGVKMRRQLDLADCALSQIIPLPPGFTKDLLL